MLYCGFKVPAFVAPGAISYFSADNMVILCILNFPKKSSMTRLNQHIARGEDLSRRADMMVGEPHCTVVSALLNGSQNATVHEKICSGRPFYSDRYWQAISDSCLDADLKLFPNGDLTEVGERGISLSGGQKQHINVC